MARPHGRGPKDVFVRQYGRWREGRYERVRDAHRGHSHRMSLRHSPDQLDFGF
jgi:hypothetical protein